MNEIKSQESFAQLPGFEKSMLIHNRLNRPINVFISPNHDYELIDIYVKIASLASSLGSLSTASGIMLAIRAVKFAKSANDLKKKLMDAIPQFSVTIPP